MYKLSENKIDGFIYTGSQLYYFCEFGTDTCPLTCKEWFAVEGQRYMRLDAWEAVCGAYDALEIDCMTEEEKNSIMLKLWDANNHLVGIFDIEEIEKICAGNYEPWKEV